jgi:RNA polymerase sigma-70 factor (ECF subfamily)
VADTTVGLHIEGCIFSHAEEDALVSALGQGAEDAYEILIQRYQQPVYSLVCRLMNDPSDAPDIVQEVFLKVFRSIGAFRGNSSLKTWIYRIAVNEAYNHRRWFCRHQRQEVALGSECLARHREVAHHAGSGSIAEDSRRQIGVRPDGAGPAGAGGERALALRTGD